MPRQGARPRLLFILATLAVAGLAFLPGITGSTRAKPPSTRIEVPPEAFRPVVLPTDGDVSGPLTSGPARVPDDGLPERPPAPSPAVTPEPSPPTGPEHVVRAGDTLWQIAVWHRADLDLILRWNDGIDPRRLVAGQRILVPGGGPMPTPSPTAPPKGPSSSAGPGQAGAHLWPLPIRGTITTRFSARHPGIDIAAPAGTPVRAIAGGTVTWAGWKTNGGGYVVVIRHPDGMVSTYNHNREVTVRVGEVVAGGQQVAAVGATGWATGPHLDLRIEMGGRLVDPLGLFQPDRP
jgi:hypothetical protein